MKNQLFIQSNTKGKALKMLQGKTFDNPLTFITEIIQNAQRAKTSRFEVSFNGDMITMKDDGCGLKKPEALLMFDYSEWGGTKEGFGIGFWSILGVPELRVVNIISNTHMLRATREQIENDLSFEHEVVPKIKGFELTLASPYIEVNKELIIQRFQDELCLMPFDSYIEGEYVLKKDLKAGVSGDFVMDFENPIFTARLAVNSNYANPVYYYEKRMVCRGYEFNNVTGVVELKKIDLREPDRKGIVANERRSRFLRKMEQCIKTLFKEFVLTIMNNDDMIDRYSEAVANILSPKEYEGLLKTNIKPTDKTVKEGRLPIKAIVEEFEENEEEKLNEIGKEEGNNEVDRATNTANTCFVKSLILEETTTDKVIKELQSCTLQTVAKVNKNTNVSDGDMGIKEYVRKTKNLVYVEANKREDYSDLIGLAKYYGVEVFVARNTLYEQYMEAYKVPHISSIEGAIHKEYSFTNMGTRTAKEANFLKLLLPILAYYELSEDLFTIAEIENKVTIASGDKVLKKRKFKNSKDNINIYAVCQENRIILDRRAIKLKAFDIKEKNLGINEIKAIIYSSNTIAHELAHYIYKTVDNTSEHKKYEHEIQQGIIELYCL